MVNNIWFKQWAIRDERGCRQLLYYSSPEAVTWSCKEIFSPPASKLSRKEGNRSSLFLRYINLTNLGLKR